jgi:hypothetical protein
MHKSRVPNAPARHAGANRLPTRLARYRATMTAYQKDDIDE